MPRISANNFAETFDYFERNVGKLSKKEQKSARRKLNAGLDLERSPQGDVFRTSTNTTVAIDSQKPALKLLAEDMAMKLLPQINVAFNKRLIADIKYLTLLLDNDIKDVAISREIEAGIERALKQKNPTKEINELINLAEIPLQTTGELYPLESDSYKYTQMAMSITKKRVEHKNLLNSLAKTLFGQKPESKDAETFQSAMHLDSLKSYLINFSEEKPELTKHLYETYYLPRLAPEVKMICQKISDEFGTKLFVEFESDPTSAQKVYNELAEWNRASKGEFRRNLVPAINLGKYESYYAGNDDSGYMRSITKDIHLNRKASDSSLRHEITHVNDYMFRDNNNIDGINLNQIIVRTPKKLSGEGGKLIWDECLYKDEFFNAGIDQEHIEYAFTDKREFVAVAAEGDHTKYSSEFKDILIRLGLPEYLFDMQVLDKNVLANADFVTQIKQKHAKIKTAEDLKAHFDANLLSPEDIKNMPPDWRNFVKA